MSDFIKRRHDQVMKELESVVLSWRLADRVEYDPSSHRKMRIKARQDKELLNVELRKLKPVIDHLKKD